MKLIMKSTVLRLMASSIIFIELAGCSLGASMEAQFTSMNIGCDPDNIEISNESVDLDGTETWTAKCGGKTYDCEYFRDAGSNCYLSDQQ